MIVTAAFDAAASARFQALRQAHYPAELNRVPAHLTLFHKLPGRLAGEVEDALAEEGWRLDPLPARAVGLRFTGRGVSVEIDAPALCAVRDRLARLWSGLLTPQDRQRFAPHVTIQNKVPPSKARRTHMGLSAIFEPFAFTLEGLQMWAYRGGPWEEAGLFPFGGGPAA
nr:2'-5' RNA ligase family protein [Alsobacter ponti]